jgi:hypothetical protein
MTEEEIKEIAEELNCGLRCFIHRKSKEILFFRTQ